MKRFVEMTDQELIDFCHINMLDLKICQALGCEELCRDEDCPMVQCLNRFEKYIANAEDNTEVKNDGNL